MLHAITDAFAAAVWSGGGETMLVLASLDRKTHVRHDFDAKAVIGQVLLAVVNVSIGRADSRRAPAVADQDGVERIVEPGGDGLVVAVNRLTVRRAGLAALRVNAAVRAGAGLIATREDCDDFLDFIVRRHAASIARRARARMKTYLTGRQFCPTLLV